MANVHRGEVSIPGTGHVLRFTNNSLCEVEDALGINLPQVFAQMNGGAPSLRLLRALVWGGLRHDKPKLTLAEAGDVIDAAGGLAVMGDLLGTALNAALGAPDEADAEKKR